MNVLKPILSLLIIVVVSLLLFIFDKKIHLKKMAKQCLYGVIFGMAAIGCNLLLVDKYLGLASSAILVGGILFGGPVGIIAGCIAAIERLIAMAYGSLELLRISAPIVLVLSGLLSLVVRKLITADGKNRWYYGFVVGGIIEIVGCLLMFLVNIGNADSAYLVLKKYGLIEVLINSFAVGGTLFAASFFDRDKNDVEKKGIGIQTKIQLSLWLTIIVGLASVTNIAFGVLNSNSTTERQTTLKLAIEDVEKNINGDVDNDFGVYIQKLISQFKGGNALIARKDFQPSQHYATYEDYCAALDTTIQSYVNPPSMFTYITYPTDFTIVSTVGGEIIASTDSFIHSLDSIYEFDIQHLELMEKYSLTEAKTLALPFEYNKQEQKMMKIVQKQHSDNFYFLISYDEEAYHNQIIHSLEKSIALRRLGEKGYLVVTDREHNVVSSPTDTIKGVLDLSMYKKNEFMTCTINDIEYYAYIDDFVGFNVVSLINKAESDYGRNTALKITVFSEFAVFLVVYVLIHLAISMNVINPLKRVNKTLGVITKGNLNEKVAEHSSNELAALSNDINATVDSLKEYMGREAKLIKRELDFAKDIQSSVLPKLTKEYSKNPNFDIFASMNPAKEVGGDFYDFQLLDSKHLFILIADVSGKGVPAAMFMMQSKTIIKALVENGNHIDLALTKANEKLLESESSGMFVTCWCAVINLETGVLEYVNAGHNPPLFIKNNKEPAYLSLKPGFVLSGMKGFKYKSEKIQMEKGDQIFLYTDGITEARSSSDELYGEKRLLECVKKISSKTSKDFCEAVFEEVNNFSKGKEQSDDITMLRFKYLGFKKEDGTNN